MPTPVEHSDPSMGPGLPEESESESEPEGPDGDDEPWPPGGTWPAETDTGGEMGMDTDEGDTLDPDGGEDGVCVSWLDLTPMLSLSRREEGAAAVNCPAAFEACGGDPSGSWTFSSDCNAHADREPAADVGGGHCADSVMISALPGGIEGSRSYVEGRFHEEETETIIHRLVIDRTVCLFETCGAYADAVGQTTGASVACDTMENTCNCTATRVEHVSRDGAYEVVDNTLVRTLDGELEPTATGFCVEDEVLAVVAAPGPASLVVHPTLACVDDLECEELLAPSLAESACVPTTP